MRNKLNQLFRLGFTLFTFSLLLTSCEKEIVLERTLEAESQESTLILKHLSKEEIEKKSKLVEKLREFNENLNENKAARTTDRAIYNSEYDFTIYTDAATYIENGDYHSYTFPLVQDADEKMTNLLFELNNLGEYDAYLVRYDYTANEFKTIDLNNLSLVTSMEPIDLDFSTLSARTYAYYRCFYFYNGTCCNNYVSGLGCGQLTGADYENYGCDWVLSTEYCELVNSIGSDSTTYNNNTATVTIGGTNYGGTGGSHTSPTPSPFDAEELMKINVVKSELGLNHPQRNWIDEWGNAQYAFQLYDYGIANMWSDYAKAFGKSAVDAWMDDGEVDFALININNLTNPCAKEIFNELEDGIYTEDLLSPEMMVPIEDPLELNFSESILSMFNDSENFNYTIVNGTPSNTAANASTEAELVSTSPNQFLITTTVNISYLSSANKLSIARTMIHELTHGYLLARGNELDFMMSMVLYASENGIDTADTNAFHHEYMSQYMNAMAYSLYEWDKDYGSGGNLGWDYYHAMAFAGQFQVNTSGIIVSTTDTFLELVPDATERQNIANIIINEQNGNSDAQGTDCN